MIKYVVTGGCGFIGGHLVDALVKLDHEVIVIDSLITGKYINDGAKYIHCDLCDLDLYDDIFKDVDAIFHVAALARIKPSMVSPEKYYKNNVLSTLRVLELCRINSIGKMIYSSSSSVSDPTNPYAHSKMIGEDLCKMYAELYGISCISLRYFNVFGTRMAHGSYATVLQNFIDCRNDGVPLKIDGYGNQRRDFTNVDDVVSANLSAVKFDTTYDVFDIGSGVNYSINEIAEAFEGPVIYSRRFEDVGRRETLADIGPAKKKLNYDPTGNVLDWIKSLQ